MSEAAPKRPRGFAAMDRARVREIAAAGGRANSRRHRFTTETARAAGARGGRVAAERRRAARARDDKTS